MLILNFSHPMTEMQKREAEALTGQGGVSRPKLSRMISGQETQWASSSPSITDSKLA